MFKIQVRKINSIANQWVDLEDVPDFPSKNAAEEWLNTADRRAGIEALQFEYQIVPA